MPPDPQETIAAGLRQQLEADIEWAAHFADPGSDALLDQLTSVVFRCSNPSG